MPTDDLTATIARVREHVAVCACSDNGATALVVDGVAKWRCLKCGATFESPPRVERRDVETILAALDAETERAEMAERLADENSEATILYARQCGEFRALAEQADGSEGIRIALQMRDEAINDMKRAVRERDAALAKLARVENALENWKLASRTHFMRCETCEGDGFMECLDHVDAATGEEFYCADVCGECGGTGDGQFAELLREARGGRQTALSGPPTDNKAPA